MVTDSEISKIFGVDYLLADFSMQKIVCPTWGICGGQPL
jgi:hypothetical protein